MASGFALCSACSRHVKLDETKCPFCRSGLLAAPPRLRPSRRSSRAEWLACGSSALAICGCMGEDRGTTSDASPVVDSTVVVADDGSPVIHPAGDALTQDVATLEATAGDAALQDVVTDAGIGIAFTPATGLFGCSPTFTGNGVGDAASCDRATQWCFTNHGFDPTGCVPLGSTCASGAPSDACSPVFYWDAAACDGGLPRCACITQTCGSGWCSDDDAGGVVVSCGACYGAPPARLEPVVRSEAVS